MVRDETGEHNTGIGIRGRTFESYYIFSARRSPNDRRNDFVINSKTEGETKISRIVPLANLDRTGYQLAKSVSICQYYPLRSNQFFAIIGQLRIVYILKL